MAKYTTSIKDIVLNKTFEFPNHSIEDRVVLACPLIFDFYYPIWDEAYRTTLETKILFKYFNKEIGLEVYKLWQIYLNTRLNEIMPYYVELYKTINLDIDFLNDVNYTEITTRNNVTHETSTVDATGKTTDNADESLVSTGENDSTSTSKGLESDLPQADYANVDYGTKLNNVDNTVNNSTNSRDTRERTNITDMEQNSNNSADRTITDTFSLTKKGLTGAHLASDMLTKYRQTLLNIDMMIIADLHDLFMMID